MVLAATSGIIAWRFQAILYDRGQGERHGDDARDRAGGRSRPIRSRSASRPSGSAAVSLQQQQSQRTGTRRPAFVQVDSTAGYPLAKTANLGGIDDSAEHRHFAPSTTSRSATSSIDGRPFFVEDRFFKQATRRRSFTSPNRSTRSTGRSRARATRIVIILAVAAVAVVLLSIVLAAQATTPINRLSQAMREIGSDRLDRRLRWERRNDEIGDLAASFDDLLRASTRRSRANGSLSPTLRTS